MTFFKKEIIAVVDPMCSWCWGFSPELEKLRKALPSDVKLSVLLGGLRSSGSQVWSDEFKNYLQEHWKNVEGATTQPFNMALFEKEHFDYNTEPSCRAVLSVRHIDESKVFDVLHALQHAFYVEGKDITQCNVIIDIVSKQGIDSLEFIKMYSSDKAKELTQADSCKARSMGANAFPSVVVVEGNGHLSTIKGYKRFETLKSLIDI